MPVQKKSLIGNTIKKAQTASQEQPQSNDLKANSLAAHSMKSKRATPLAANAHKGSFNVAAFKVPG